MFLLFLICGCFAITIQQELAAYEMLHGAVCALPKQNRIESCKRLSEKINELKIEIANINMVKLTYYEVQSI